MIRRLWFPRFRVDGVADGDQTSIMLVKGSGWRLLSVLELRDAFGEGRVVEADCFVVAGLARYPVSGIL